MEIKVKFQISVRMGQHITRTANLSEVTFTENQIWLIAIFLVGERLNRF